MTQVIQESAEYFDSTYEKVESADKNEAILEVRRGPLQSVGKENQNGRVYTEDFWKDVFNSEETRQRLERKLFLGRLSHPPSGDVEFDLNFVSHTVSDFWRGKPENDENPELIYGDVEIIDTDAGRQLKTFFDAGIDIGFSSRSLVVPEEEDGTEYIKKGSVWGWDAVLNQSVGSAHGLEQLDESGRELNFDDTNDLLSELESFRDSNENAKVVCEAVNITDSKEEQDMGDVTEEDVEELENEIQKLEEENEDLKEELEEQNQSSVSEIHTLAREKEEAIDIAFEIADLFEQRQEKWKDKFEGLKEDYKDDLETSIEEIETLQESLSEDEEKQKAAEAVRLAEEAISELEEYHEYEPYIDKAIEKLQDIPELEDVAEEAIDQLEETKEERDELVDVSLELVDMVEEKEDQLQELKEEALEAIDEAEQTTREKEKEAKVVAFAESCLHDLGMAENDEIREFFYESDTLQQVENKYKNIKGLREDNDMPGYMKREELEDLVDNEEENEEANRTQRIIEKSQGHDRPTRS